jgi:hypothetical protein
MPVYITHVVLAKNFLVSDESGKRGFDLEVVGLT